MGNSKQIISGNKISICTATASYLESLMVNGVIDDKELKKLCKMATDAAKGRLKD